MQSGWMGGDGDLHISHMKAGLLLLNKIVEKRVWFAADTLSYVTIFTCYKSLEGRPNFFFRTIMQKKAFGRNRRTVSYVTCHKSLEGGPNFFFGKNY
jgi:hypothetical protein